jgi:hypothetical protein
MCAVLGVQPYSRASRHARDSSRRLAGLSAGNSLVVVCVDVDAWRVLVVVDAAIGELYPASAHFGRPLASRTKRVSSVEGAELVVPEFPAFAVGYGAGGQREPGRGWVVVVGMASYLSLGLLAP